MSKRRPYLAGLAAIAVALTVVANVLTSARLTMGLGVLVVEIVGGLAIGWAAISQFRFWSSESARLAWREDLFVRGFSILVVGLLGPILGAGIQDGPEPLNAS